MDDDEPTFSSVGLTSTSTSPVQGPLTCFTVSSTPPISTPTGPRSRSQSIRDSSGAMNLSECEKGTAIGGSVLSERRWDELSGSSFSGAAPELSLPGSTSYSSYTSDEQIVTPPSSWNTGRAPAIARPSIIGELGTSFGDLGYDDDERDTVPWQRKSRPGSSTDPKGKGKAKAIDSPTYKQLAGQHGRDSASLCLPASPGLSPALAVGTSSSRSPLVESPSLILPSSPYQHLVVGNVTTDSTSIVGRPGQPPRAHTQPVLPQSDPTSPIAPEVTYTAVSTSGRSTPSRFMSRSRANSLLSFSPAGSVSSSTSGTASLVGRKLDEIKDKLKLTKIGVFTKKKVSQGKEARDGSDTSALEPLQPPPRRRTLFGQRRRTIGALDEPSASMPSLSRSPASSPFISGAGPTLELGISTGAIPPRPVSRTAPSLALRPIVTRAVTTTSLTPPIYPIPTPFSLPARSSAPASPTLRTMGLPFLSAAPSSNPSLLSLTRPSSPAPPKPVDYFDRMLPREIKVLVFRTLLDIWTSHEGASVRKADRWFGEVGGRRELIRLSRVSKGWLSLVYDGELWPSLSARPFANLPPMEGSVATSPTRNSFLPVPSTAAAISIPTSTLLAITSQAGPFIRSLDLRNLTTLSSATMHALALAASPVPLGSVRRSFDIAPDGLRGLGLDEKDGVTRLTRLDLAGCRSFSGYALHHLLAKSPFLMRLNLRAIPVVTNNTCTVLFTHCPLLVSVDLSRCPNIDAFGVALLTGRAPTQIGHLQGRSPPPARPMKELRLAGLKSIDDDLLVALAGGMPSLQILDLSGCKSLTDDHLRSFVTVTSASSNQSARPDPGIRTVTLSSRDMGLDPASSTIYFKRLTSLRHLNLSSCTHLTDVGLGHLAHTMPRLEFLEAAGFGPKMRDEGLVRLLETTPGIRKLDLENASEITDIVLGTLTPDEDGIGPGAKMEHLVLSYVGRVTAEAMLTLVRKCKRLRVLEADNSRVSDPVVKEFVRLAASRRVLKAEMTVTDSRTVSKAVLTDLHQRLTRPRRGFRGFAALPFEYQDATVDADLAWGPGRSEIDDTRVVLHSFWGWSLVDAVRLEVAKEKKRKAVIAAAMASLGGGGAEAGPSAQLSTISGGRRLLGWRSSSGSGVVMLDGVQPGAINTSTGGAAASPQGASPGGVTPASMESMMDPRDPRAQCVVM